MPVARLPWGRLPKSAFRATALSWGDELWPSGGKPSLPVGLARSYGDSGVPADGGCAMAADGMDRILDFNPERQTLRCQAGVTLDALLGYLVPRGFFLPVIPGTRQVTVGGAIANDIHSKNHHLRGTFGCQVNEFVLRRSDGECLRCSLHENTDWFGATIGGLGLTGLILEAELTIVPVHSHLIDTVTERFGRVGDFFSLNDQFLKSHEYTVAWIDGTARGPHLGRGLYMAGNHARVKPDELRPHSARQIGVPLAPPFNPLVKPAIKVFNELYYRRIPVKGRRTIVPYSSFFNPLDSIGNWNRLYGPRGFYQYQCVLPWKDGQEVTKSLLERISASGQASFLAVLKTFGGLSSPGWLSFPFEGITLALDFPNRSEATLSLFRDLDHIVNSAGGRLYPAKDAVMEEAFFKQAYPRWKDVERYRDPALLSSFWSRVVPESASSHLES